MECKPRPASALDTIDGADRDANESQDSQELVETYMGSYGVGLISSSPVAEYRLLDNMPHLPVQAAPGNTWKVHQGFVGGPGRQIKLRRHATINVHRVSRGTASSVLVDTVHDSGTTHSRTSRLVSAVTSKPDLVTGEVTPDSVALEGDREAPSNSHCWEFTCKDDRSQDVAPTQFLGAREGGSNMDSSQSPTQSNDGRSYEQYYKSSSPSGLDDLPSTALDFRVDGHPLSSQDQKTLDEDDTGAVRFENNHLARHDTQSTTADRSDIVDFGTVPRFHAETQSTAHHESFRFPETPAQPRNPFAAQDRAQILGGSQLFRQTQFSSAVRAVSPTSSRPSPNGFQHNSISPNPLISSPLKTRGLLTSPLLQPTSSPRGVVDPVSEPIESDEVPIGEESPKKPAIPESPLISEFKKQCLPEPMDRYEPMGLSQHRRESSRVHEDYDDDSSEEDFQRRRRAEEKKFSAARQLTSINFAQSSASEEVEVPSTNKKLRRSQLSAPDDVVAVDEVTSTSQGQDTVADSQRQQVVAQSLETNDLASQGDSSMTKPLSPSKHGGVGTRHISLGPGGVPLEKGTADTPAPWSHSVDQGDAIPETSPVPQYARPPSTLEHQPSTISTAPSNAPRMLVPRSEESSDDALHEDKMPEEETATPTVKSTRHLVEGMVENGYLPGASEHESANDADHSSPALPKPSKLQQTSSTSPVSSSPPAFSTRARKRAHIISSSRTGSVSSGSAPPISESTLSSLSSTPILSDGIKSTSENQEQITHTGNGDESSPAVSRELRRRASGALPKLKTYGGHARTTMRQRKPPSYLDPASTDELVRSPSVTPTFERSVNIKTSRNATNSRLGRGLSRTLSLSRDSSLSTQHLFRGMAFAISFQSKKPGETSDQYDERMKTAKSLERKIEQAGGKVLTSGFDELFDHPPVGSTSSSPSSTPDSGVDIQLTPSAASTGFTALIADGHSRKVKYMQALALGLPCLASHWVMSCLEHNRLVDWAPYLLCAGQSAFLGDAVRSRNLVPYEACTAKLVEVVEHRTRLLAGSRILLVMKKADESKRMAYVFLARVLGAALTRVHSVEEAKARLKAMDALSRPYDWVYIDEKTTDSDSLIATSAGTSKKRKRGKSASKTAPLSKKIKTLSDELVIQSLILGKLIDEG